jgi:hypothetical protein
MRPMSKYNNLLKEIRTKAEGFFISTAKEYIPKMYQALRNENPNLTPEGARDRIEKDCVDIWSKRTILDALPDEAKDLEKQKAGRLSQKEPNSAAVSAAPLSTNKKEEEIIIDTEGKPIENNILPSPAPLITTTIDDLSSSDSNEGQLQNYDDNLLHFEFFIPSKDVVKSIFRPPDEGGDKEEKDQFWINGILDKHTGEVISATIGRISQQECRSTR